MFLSVSGSITGRENVGGICGYNDGGIYACEFDGTVNGGTYAGGICGYNVMNITNCMNYGAVNSSSYSGGICGNNDLGYVRYCVSLGTVSGDSYVGSICGNSSGSNNNVAVCVYDKTACTVGGTNGKDGNGASGAGLDQLCSGSLYNGYHDKIWESGYTKITTDDSDSRFGKRTAFYISLKAFGHAKTAGEDVSVYNYNYQGTDDWDTYELISTADEFIALGDDADKLAGNYVLANDISFKDKGVFRVAVYAPFTGKFSGDGHAMTDVSMSGGYSLLAPFGKNSGLIIDLSVSGDISQKSKNARAGGICAANYNGTVANCMFVGSVSGNEIVGGICGENDGGYVKNCVVAAEVSADEYVGAICGSAGQYSVNITNCYYDSDMCSVGGINGSDGAGTTGLSKEDLCGITPNLSDVHWTPGSIVPKTNNWVLVITYSYPRLNNASEAHTAVTTQCDYSIDGTGVYEDCTVIYTAEEFVALTKDKTAWGRNYALGNDIDLTGKTITSIGTDMNYPFTGKFSGNGYTIQNVTINSPDTEFVGIFGVNRGHISDLSATGSVTGKNFVGGICGLNDTNCVINNCSFDGEVTGKEHIGGVCGQNNGAMNTCRSGSKVNGSSNVGGICGYNIGSLTASNATDPVSGSNSVGGVCGYNSGSISQSSSESKVSGDYGVGGVCGYVSSNGTVSDSFNVGEVSGGGTAGGVCGYNYGSISTCYSAGTVTGTSYIGGVCGVDGNNSTITDCYYDKQFCTENNKLGTGLTHSQFCGALPAGFSNAVWQKGNMDIRSTNGKFRDVSFAYPTLINTYGAIYRIKAQQFNFGNGSGDWEDFNLITTAEQFAAIGNSYTKWTDNYVLGNDIDLKGTTLKWIGSKSVPFSGKFSGDGYAIRNMTSENGGLFWYNSGLIEDIILESGKISGAKMTGGICDNNSGVILRCGNGAEINANGSAGGIVGENTGTVGNCFNVGSVTAASEAGGICVTNSGTIENCYNAGKIKTEDGGTRADICTNNGGTITNCWGAESSGGNSIKLMNLLSSGSITEMGFSTNVWTKLPNDRENQTAYYPSTSGRHSFSTSYEAYLIFDQSDKKETPVYLDNVKFDYAAMLKFSDTNDISVTPKACAIKIGGRTIADSNGDLSLYKNLYTYKLDTAGKTTFTFWCDGSNSEFLPDELTENCTLNIEKREPAASDFVFALSESKFDGSAKEVTVDPAAGIAGMGEVTVHYYSDGKPLDSAPVNAGDYTFTIDAAEGDNYKAASGLTDSSWKFTIEKADAPQLNNHYAYYTWAETGERKVTVAGLPENMGNIGTPTYTVTGSIFKENSVSYSDGDIYFTLAPGNEVNQVGYITVTIPTQNYEDISVKLCVGISEKYNRQSPEPMDFDLVFTSEGSDITAKIATELYEVEFSFDGVNWSDVNTASVGHEQAVTGYIRFIETERYNVSLASSKTVNSGHGMLIRHERVEPDCTKQGSSEYWECAVCGKYFSDKDGTTEITLESTVLAITNHTEAPAVKENEKPATCTEDGSYDEAVYCSVCRTKLSTEHKTVPATGHKWSEKYEADKSGHWHKCEVCSAASETEKHVSGGPATTLRAEICTVCGYEISPKKSSGGSGGYGGSSGGSKNTPAENKPVLNGVQKSWTEMSAELAGQNGGSAVIMLNGETTVPADVIRAIMNNRIKTEFVIDSVKSWIVDGGKITAVNAADFSAFPGNADKTALRGTNGADLKIRGTGVPADLKLKFRKEYAGQFANVYKLADGKLSFHGCFKVGTDGAVVISGANTAGEYIVMVCEYSDLPGDMTNDGVLNALDASAILKSIVGAADGANPLMADFNGDGVVNALDASAILKYIVGLAA